MECQCGITSRHIHDLLFGREYRHWHHSLCLGIIGLGGAVPHL